MNDLNSIIWLPSWNISEIFWLFSWLLLLYHYFWFGFYLNGYFKSFSLSFSPSPFRKKTKYYIHEYSVARERNICEMAITTNNNEQQRQLTTLKPSAANNLNIFHYYYYYMDGQQKKKNGIFILLAFFTFFFLV